MAFIALPYVASYTFRDNNGEESTVTLNLSADAAPADAVAAAGTIANSIAVLSNATLVRYSLSRVFEENAPATPPQESEVERKLALSYKSQNLQRVIVNVPSVVFGVETPGTNVVSAASVTTFANALISGFDGGVQVVSNAGSPISTLERAYIVHRYRKP